MVKPSRFCPNFFAYDRPLYWHKHIPQQLWRLIAIHLTRLTPPSPMPKVKKEKIQPSLKNTVNLYLRLPFTGPPVTCYVHPNVFLETKQNARSVREQLNSANVKFVQMTTEEMEKVRLHKFGREAKNTFIAFILPSAAEARNLMRFFNGQYQLPTLKISRFLFLQELYIANRTPRMTQMFNPEFNYNAVRAYCEENS
jgi:hypothetical protein